MEFFSEISSSAFSPCWSSIIIFVQVLLLRLKGIGDFGEWINPKSFLEFSILFIKFSSADLHSSYSWLSLLIVWAISPHYSPGATWILSGISLDYLFSNCFCQFWFKLLSSLILYWLGKFILKLSIAKFYSCFYWEFNFYYFLNFSFLLFNLAILYSDILLISCLIRKNSIIFLAYILALIYAETDISSFLSNIFWS